MPYQWRQAGSVQGASRREYPAVLPSGATPHGASARHPEGAPTSAHLLRCDPWQYARYSLRAAPCIWALVGALIRHY